MVDTAFGNPCIVDFPIAKATENPNRRLLEAGAYEYISFKDAIYLASLVFAFNDSEILKIFFDYEEKDGLSIRLQTLCPRNLKTERGK